MNIPVLFSAILFATAPVLAAQSTESPPLTTAELETFLGLTHWVYLLGENRVSNVHSYSMVLRSKDGKDLQTFGEVKIPEAASDRRLRLACAILTRVDTSTLQLGLMLTEAEEPAKKIFLPKFVSSFKLTGDRVTNFARFPQNRIEDLSGGSVMLLRFDNTGETIQLVSQRD